MKRLLPLLALLLTVSGCTLFSRQTEPSPYVADARLIVASHTAVDRLLATFPATRRLDRQQPIIVASLVNIDDLQSSRLGRAIESTLRLIAERDALKRRLAETEQAVSGFRALMECTSDAVKVIDLDWQPPRDGVPRLRRTKSGVSMDAANQEVVSRIKRGQAVLVGMGIARDVIPGMHERMILHAGPPIEWERMCGPSAMTAISRMCSRKSQPDGGTFRPMLN